MNKSNIWRGFASDNNAGVHPEILKELSEVNKGHAIGYGADNYSEEAISLFKDHFGADTDVYLVFTGTAANVLGITAVARSWNSVITASTAHIEQDECGAPEKFSGCKVLTVDTPDGKLKTELLFRKKNCPAVFCDHHHYPGKERQ